MDQEGPATGNNKNLASLVAVLLTRTGPFVEDDIDAEINRRLAAMMDASDGDGTRPSGGFMGSDPA